ncbi:hypothetical protein FQV39_28615 [Bosea sp. F3-2]|uniref:hypothetical protein n=1 Tax=Bosea sp. F3-2 TaxID=2599640 RepID=UPI0011EE3F36|nr:hypothetical protein [Bosea sp. F3-2]QEL26129.1 hypothetical protein FQV39_28615 [Bosea sp. F3-2]
MTPAQRELARHALGLPNATGRSYRNRYFTPANGEVSNQWRAMIEAGEAEGGKPARRQSSLFFCLTRNGAELALNPGEWLSLEDFPR